MMRPLTTLINGRNIALALSAAALLAACSGEQQTEAPKNRSSVTKPAIEEVAKELANTTANTKRGKASIRLGDDTFDLDLVICVGTSMATAIASDRAKRAGYPIITIKTYDPALSGGVTQDSILVFIDRDDYQEQWKMQNGDVTRRDNVFTAHGALEGFRMVEQEGGTTKRVQLEGVSSKAFHTRIECK